MSTEFKGLAPIPAAQFQFMHRSCYFTHLLQDGYTRFQEEFILAFLGLDPRGFEIICYGKLLECAPSGRQWTTDCPPSVSPCHRHYSQVLPKLHVPFLGVACSDLVWPAAPQSASHSSRLHVLRAAPAASRRESEQGFPSWWKASKMYDWSQVLIEYLPCCWRCLAAPWRLRTYHTAPSEKQGQSRSHEVFFALHARKNRCYVQNCDERCLELGTWGSNLFDLGVRKVGLLSSKPES